MAAPAGITGMTGLQGLRGIQGPPRYAFEGPPFGYTTARLTTSTPTDGGNAVYLTPQNLGTWHNITSSLFSGNSATLTIYLPGYYPIYSTAPPVALSTSSWGGDNLVIETAAPHKLRLQSLVTLANMTFNSSLNGTYRVQSIGSATQFTVYTSTPGPGNNNVETGTVTESTAVETTNEAFPTPEQAGNFWLFKNNDSRSRTVNFINGPVTYEGNDLTTTLEFAKGQKMTVLYTGSNFIVL
jgi:hypothetical protein